MTTRVLVIPGFSGAERACPALSRFREVFAEATWLRAGAPLEEAREACAEIQRAGAEASVLGMGAGCAQALLLAQGYDVARVACVMPGEDADLGSAAERFLAGRNMFAVTAPLLVADRPLAREARRILRAANGKKAWMALKGAREDAEAIARFLNGGESPNDDWE